MYKMTGFLSTQSLTTTGLCSPYVMFGNTFFLRFALLSLVACNAVLAASVATNNPDLANLVTADST